MPQDLDTLPELLVSDDRDPAAARRIRRLAGAGRLRRLYAGIYTYPSFCTVTHSLNCDGRKRYLAILPS